MGYFPLHMPLHNGLFSKIWGSFPLCPPSPLYNHHNGRGGVCVLYVSGDYRKDLDLVCRTVNTNRIDPILGSYPFRKNVS